MSGRRPALWAIDSMIEAARAPAGRAGMAAAEAVPGRPVPVDPRYALLLSRILAVAAAEGVPCVQFLPCGGEAPATPIASGVARAAAALLGRALLLGARMDAPPHGGAADGAALPDAFVPRLYHLRLGQDPADGGVLFGRSRRELLVALAAPFRFVAVDGPAPGAGPSASALAPLCAGSVLVVQAGRTTRGAIAAASLQIRESGGRVLGVVLDDAPAGLPRWVGAA